MSESNTTPDQGDERRAFESAIRQLHPEWSFTTDPVFGYHNERTRCAWEAWQAARALSVAQPVAQPVVDQEPASMSDNGSCGSQVSGKPASAEAGKGVEAVAWQTAEVRAEEDGFSIIGWNTVTLAAFNASRLPKRALYASPSESVAVSGEVSERVAKCSAILTLIDNYAPEKLGTAERTHLAVAVDAVLALAAPVPQPEPTSKGDQS